MDLPPFDRYAKCTKCGNEIDKPIPAPLPTAPPGGAPTSPTKPAPKAPKEAAAAPPAPKGPMTMPLKAPMPTVEYCNGSECPWGDDTEGLGEHMHQFCDVCGYEWLSKPLDWKAG